jgi:hypothetical protein
MGSAVSSIWEGCSPLTPNPSPAKGEGNPAENRSLGLDFIRAALLLHDKGEGETSRFRALAFYGRGRKTLGVLETYAGEGFTM